MSEHSIKVPRLYKIAAKIAEQFATGHGSIKKLVFDAHHPNLKAIYSLVCTTFQQIRRLGYILTRSELLKKEPRLNEWLARILITELLWGKKQLNSDAKPIKTILAYRQIFEELNNDDHLIEPNNPKQVEKPRYVRVNTLIANTEDIINQLRDEGWIFSRCFNETYKEFLDKINNLQPEEFTIDYHIPDLLVFARKTEFYGSKAYKNGEIILQDKASCLPVQLLNPQPGSCVLDMCAAPGIKTTQIAALMKNEGKIYAIELNQERYNIMNKLIGDSGVQCVETLNRDASTLTADEVPNVEYILVDPSCSGSGITDRLETPINGDCHDPFRLKKLRGFQAVILRHALRQFPNAKRVVYSTCSLSPQENEFVVGDVLESCENFKLVDLKEIMADRWINYGSFGGIGERCLYARPTIDHTNGFFVAMFERLQPSECREFYCPKSQKFFQTDDEPPEKKRRKTTNHADANNSEKINKGDVDEQNANEMIDANSSGNTEKLKKKKKKTNNGDINEQNTNEIIDANNSGKTQNLKKKKKKTNNGDVNEQNTTAIIDDNNSEQPKKLKKKKKCVNDIDDDQYETNRNDEMNESNNEEKIRKNKRKTAKNSKKKATSSNDIEKEERDSAVEDNAIEKNYPETEETVSKRKTKIKKKKNHK